MLERGDGLATSYGQCEKLVVDGWSLLSPLMSVDVEQTRGIRRYVAVQTSTPHRRRAKPKPGAAPRPEPEIEDPLEKEVSGFLIVEHDVSPLSLALFLSSETDMMQLLTQRRFSRRRSSRTVPPSSPSRCPVRPRRPRRRPALLLADSPTFPCSQGPSRATRSTPPRSCSTRRSSASGPTFATTTLSGASTARRPTPSRGACGASRRSRPTRA